MSHHVYFSVRILVKKIIFYHQLLLLLSLSYLFYMHVVFQAKEKCAQQQQEKAQEQDDNYTELSNGIHGDLLTENPEVAQSGFGQHRVIPDRWKGMSPRQVQQIRETQERQEEEKKVHTLVDAPVTHSLRFSIEFQSNFFLHSYM